MSFWTCGPFKEAADRIEVANFKMMQQMLFQDIIKELQQVENLIENGTIDEKILAAMMHPDIESKLNTILGIPKNDNGQTKSNEILGETIRKSFSRIAEE
tara:strand:+ start:690 stop:989 length:300 start_codon:yes stop_codon:yes gene_type:complete